MRLLPHGRRLVCAIAVIAVVAGCGDGETRSAASFCSRLQKEKAAYLGKYNARSESLASSGLDDLTKGLASFGSAFEAMGDVVIIFDKLERVAPDDIQPDVAAIHDSLKKQIDSAGDSFKNPLGALAGGLVSGLTTMGSWRRVEQYIEANC